MTVRLPLADGTGEAGRATMTFRAILAAPWWAAALATLVATDAWIDVSAVRVPAFDGKGLMLANAWRGPWLDAAFLGLTWLGSLVLLLPLVIGAGVRLWRRGRRLEARFLVAALVGASLLAQLAKHLAQRTRPDLFAALVPVASSLSFPSSHAVQVTAAAVASWMLVARLAPRFRGWVTPGLVLVVALVGFSRLYLQQHYPSDVLAGILTAGFWVAGLRACMFAKGLTRRG